MTIFVVRPGVKLSLLYQGGKKQRVVKSRVLRKVSLTTAYEGSSKRRLIKLHNEELHGVFS
jgi:hypothetical protein